MVRCVHRTTIHLTDAQRDVLGARAGAEGVSWAEFIRRMLDRSLQGEPDRLTADLAAIRDSFGTLGDEEIVVGRDDGP